MEQVILWIIIAIAALAVDVATTSFFFSGFTIGGISALIAQIFGANFTIQLVVFILLSAVSIVLEYFWLRTKLKATIPKTLRMEEEYVGREMTAEDEIVFSSKVKLGGIYWTVENAGEPIKRDEKFTIIGIKGNKLIIRKQGGINL